MENSDVLKRLTCSVYMCIVRTILIKSMYFVLQLSHVYSQEQGNNQTGEPSPDKLSLLTLAILG